MTQSPLPEWEEVRPVASGAARKYRKGMRDLGQGLVALGVLQGVLALLGLLSAFDPLLLGLLGGLGVIHLTLGILTLLRLAWANTAVAIWGTLVVVGALLAFGYGHQVNPDKPNFGAGVGLLVGGVIVYSAVKNNRLRREAREAGEEI
jgi:hypothetical protein